MQLPLFPLHVVLFPGRPLPLHIFEPRYRQLLADCLAAEHKFGVVAIRSGREVAADVDIFNVGTVAQIERVVELPDGRANIVTRGCARFRILERLPPAPYLRATVEVLPDASDRPDNGQSELLRALLQPYLAGLGAPRELLTRLPSEPAELAWLAAAAVQVEVPEQQQLLELDSVSARVEETVRMLRRETGIMRHLGTVGSLRPPGPGGAELN